MGLTATVGVGVGVNVGDGGGCVGVGVGVDGWYVKVQVNSCTHPVPQLKAQAAMCMVLRPGTTGVVL